ncbi:TPA: restriction endonuclease subunit S [Streptococcus suis]
MTRMKDSGIEWIGEVPEEWGLKPIKYLATYDDSILSQSEINQNITINYVDIGSVNLIEGITNSERFNTLEAPSRARRKTQVGDTIVSTVRTYLKAIAYISNEQNYIVSTGFCVLRPSCIDSRFFSYAVKSDSFTKLVEKYAWGVSYPAISSSQLVNLPIAFPKSLPEQTQIADFLDKKVAQLDKVKSLLEEQIKTLEDYRQSLIYETVTKGLDKTVPLKDSGVDWIGQIPEGWEVKPIKHIFDVIGSGTTPDSSKAEYYDGDINWLQSGDLYKKDYVDSVSKTITDLGYLSSASLRIYEAPFLAIAMYGASIGNLAISKIDACVNQAVAVLKGEEDIVRFVKFALEISKSELIFAAQGGTQPNINQVLIKNWLIPFPSEIEIRKIADFLDKKTEQINQMIAVKKEQIENINKQRQTLIYDYVTGKRRV